MLYPAELRGLNLLSIVRATFQAIWVACREQWLLNSKSKTIG